jgi:uncharacterized protein (DUF1684 family)
MSGLCRAVLIVTGALFMVPSSAVGQDYRAEILSWRSEKEKALVADRGWLSVVGLFWLKDGPNRFGTDPANDIVLPAESAPAQAGTFSFQAGHTTVSLEPNVVAEVGGERLNGPRELRPDTDGTPDFLILRDLTMQVIKRGERYGVRLRDKNSQFRRDFSGRSWFPVDEKWRVSARFVRHDPPRPIRIQSVIGTSEAMPSPGYAEFTVGETTVRIDGVLEEPDADQLFFIFKDQTSGKDTYPAGRFLYAELPKGDTIVLDFNKAYNPPCAFTPYATCPLPPPQNWLKLRIDAGELHYGRH